MTEAPRGTPPNQKQLQRALGGSLKLWDAVIAMGREFGATWRWMHSEATGQWSYRSYLPGERFFMALSLREPSFEVSLNLKAEEWDLIAGESHAERAYLDAIQEKARASGDEPAWVHALVTEEAQLPAVAKLLFARGRRVQPPRKKKR
jgi:hypothetical protein